MALWPSWSPLVRSAGPLPHSRRTWCILGDPPRSGQPRRRTKSHATVGQELHWAHRPTEARLPADETGKQANAPAGGPTQPGRSRLRRKRPRGSPSRGRPSCVAARKSACGPLAVTSRLALGEAVLGLQQPTNHQQHAHQVIERLAGGLPVRIGDRPDQQRMGLAMLLRGNPPRVRHPRPLCQAALRAL